MVGGRAMGGLSARGGANGVKATLAKVRNGISAKISLVWRK